jgi:hypothetical protein
MFVRLPFENTLNRATISRKRMIQNAIFLVLFTCGSPVRSPAAILRLT